MNKKRTYDRFLQGLTLLFLLNPSPAWTSPESKAPISYSAVDLQSSVNEAASTNPPEQPALAAATPSTQPSELNTQQALDLPPALIEKSPVLRRWSEQIPDVAADITNDPSFRTRIRLGYSNGSSAHAVGLNIGVQDVRLDRTRLAISADYQAALAGDRGSWGSDLRYYVRPLGSYINVAPVVGYRHLKRTDDSVSGVNLGFHVLFALSRGGGSDISLTQTWVAPGSHEEAGLLTLSFGYALTRQIRFSTDLQRQNTRRDRESRFGVGLEWML
jgi:hypothetical protein